MSLALGSRARRKPGSTLGASVGLGQGLWHVLWAFTVTKLVNKHGIAFRPATVNEAHANSKNKSEFLPHVNLSLSRSLTHVIFSFFVPGCCCYGTTAAVQDFPFMTATKGTSACGLVSMRAYAPGVNSVTLLSANLYTGTWLTMASSGTYTAVHAV